MADGGLKVPLIVDKEGGTKQVNEWLQEESPTLPVEVDLDPAEQGAKDAEKAFKALGKTGEDNLKKIESEAKKAGEATKSIASRLTMQDAIGGLGDFKDILEKTGESVFGLEKATVKAATSTLDLAEKGGKALAVFGPWGAAIGAVGGALLGYISATNEAEAATRALIKAANDKRDLDIKIAKEAQDKALGEGKETATATFEKIVKLNEKADDVINKLTYAEDETSKTLRSNLAQVEEDAKKIGNSIEGLQNENARLAAITSTDAEDRQRLQKLTEENTAKIKDKQQELNEVYATGNDLIKQSNDLFSATPAKADKATATKKGAVKETKTALDEELEANKEFERQLASSKEQWRLQDIEDELEWIKTVEDYEKKKADNTYRFNLTEGERLRQLRIKQQQEELAAAKALEEEKRQAVQETTEALQTYILPAVEEVTGTLYKNIEEGNKAFAGFGDAVARGVAGALKALGKQFGVQALGEAAAGLASLALGPVGGISAGQHFAAAAGFAAAALAAGVAGALVASTAQPSTASPATPASSSGGSQGFSGGPGAQAQSFQTDVRPGLTINVSGVPFGVLSLRELDAIGGRVTEAAHVHTQGKGRLH